MHRIGRWVMREPAATAAKLSSLDMLCRRLLGCGSPRADALTPASARFLDLSEPQLAEAVFALSALLGSEHGGKVRVCGKVGEHSGKVGEHGGKVGEHGGKVYVCGGEGGQAWRAVGGHGRKWEGTAETACAWKGGLVRRVVRCILLFLQG